MKIPESVYRPFVRVVAGLLLIGGYSWWQAENFNRNEMELILLWVLFGSGTEVLMRWKKKP